MACLLHRHEHSAPAPGAGDPVPFAEPGVEPHYGPDRTVAIDHLDLTLRIDPTRRTFQGEATFRLRPLASFQGVLAFDLDDVVVESVVDGAGRPLDWRHAGDALRVRADEVPERITVRWSGHDPSRGLYFTGPTDWAPSRQHMAWTQFQDEDGHFVVPCHDHPGSKHPWRITLEGPTGYTLLSNGRLIEEGSRSGWGYAVYEQAEPMPAYLFTAVVALLSVVEASWRDRPVRYLVPVGEEAAVGRAFGKTPRMIEAFSRLTGVDYPWPRYDQVVVHDFIFGGMENIACTTMTDVILVDDRGALEWDPEGLVAHELAHQWFGDLVTCRDWSQGWLNESWATFMESVWWEEDRSVEEATWYRWNTAGEYFSEASSRYRRPIVSYQFREPIDVFDRHLYQKGACVLWTLRRELGPAGFWSGTRAYLERNAHGTVHTRDFQDALERASGRNLDRFFAQWTHSPGHPQVEVQLGEGEKLLTVHVSQTQEGAGVPEAFRFGLELEVVFESGATQRLSLPVEDRKRAWAIPIGGGTISHVRVDPGFGVLAELALKGPTGWLEKLLDDPCPVLALRAARGLLASDANRATIAVRRALVAHPFHGVRGAVAGELGKRGTPADIDALLDALTTERDPRVTRAIVAGLGGSREKRVADALVRHLDADSPTWQLRGALLASLGRTRDPRAVPAIEAHLDTPSWSDHVAQKAIAGLAATEEPRVLGTLLERSRPHHPDRVRAAAAAALGSFADKVEAARGPAVERLVEMLVEPGFRAQVTAITALGEARDPRAVPRLEQMRATAPDGRTRRTAYEALLRIRSGRTTEDGLAGLRRQLEELAEANRRLRDRLDRVERGPA